MRIRRATAADAADLHDVAAATFPLASPPETLPESNAHFIENHLSEARFEDYLSDPERDLFVADDGGEIVGYTMLVFGEPHDRDAAAAITTRPSCELSKVYVLPGSHGSGVAQALVRASIEAASERGVAAVWLGVNQKNARANRFYEKSGFVRVGTKRFLVGENYEDDFVRERIL
ncbi:MAG TPA: GNAT family N-acetyltransferase [Galbitalea sp.]|nr:GNAT family N-acetyltransferase [Galbitalea sp.]